MFLVGGENLIDFIQEQSDGGYPVYRAIPGGSPYNVAKAMARQGVETGYLTPFSNDPLGQLLHDHLAQETRITALAARSAKPTSLAVVSLLEGQAAYQFYREGTAERDVTAAGLTASLPENVTGVFIGSLAITDGTDAAAWEELAMQLHAKGVPVVLDPNIRAAFIHDREAFLARLHRLLGVANLVKLSDEDISWICPGEDPHEAARALASQSSAALFVLTQGGEGAFGICNGAEVEVPVHPVPDLKDTVGAGDTFMGTLVAATQARAAATGEGLETLDADGAVEILRLAAKAAAINCGRAGCDPPTSEELSS